MKILIACGGTGGHIFPAVSVAQELKKDSKNEIIFITTKKSRDKDILVKTANNVHAITIAPMPTKIGLGFFMFGGKFIIGLFQSLHLILRSRPDVVAGFGGYVCGPVVMAGKFLGKPTLIHEQNVYPGRANKFVAGFADKIALSFEDTKKYLKKGDFFVSGNPIRKEFETTQRDEARKKLGIENGEFNILIMGGSQGSHKINTIAPEAIKEIKGSFGNICVTHITGKDDEEIVKEKYRQINVPHLVYPFLANIWYAIKAADLVVARSGASSITEFAASGLVSIFIPYPYALAHQKQNALVLKNQNACEIIDDSELTKETLKEKIAELIKDRNRASRMGENIKKFYNADSSKIIAEEIINLGTR